MKKVVLFLMFLGCFFGGEAQTNFRQLTFDEAITAAKVENKQVFIDFYTEWCGPCKVMARDIFPQKILGDYLNKHFVCIKLDAEKEGREVSAHYKIEVFPTYIIVDVTGKEIFRKTGWISSENLIAVIGSAIDPEKTPECLKKRYESGERSAEVVRAYVGIRMEKIMRKRNNQAEKEEIFQIVLDYFKKLTDAERLAPENIFMYMEYIDNPTQEIGQFMIVHRNEFEVSLRKEVNKRIEQLFQYYIGGILNCSVPFNETDYYLAKKNIEEIGLNNNNEYTIAFKFIECHAAGNMDAYMDLFEKEYGNLSELQQDMLVFRLNSVIQPNTETEKTRLINIVRRRLREMTARQIYFVAPILKELEKYEF